MDGVANPIASRRIGVIVGILAVGIVISVGGYWWFSSRQSSQPSDGSSASTSATVADSTAPSAASSSIKDSTTAPVVTSSEPATPVSPVETIPNRLLAQSENRNGVAVGYVKTSKPVSYWSFPFARAVAATIAYAPTLFYTKPVSGVPQLFSFDLTTNTETQRTKEATYGVGGAIVSSVSQRLAYPHYLKWDEGRKWPDNEECQLVIENLATSEQTSRAAVASHCDEPISWSPDGKRLLFSERQNALGASDAGQRRLFLYQAETGKTTELTPPTELNSLGWSAVQWHGDTEVLAPFQFTQNLVPGTEQYFRINVTDGSMTAYELPTQNAGMTQLTADRIFSISSDHQLLSAPIDQPASTSPISGASDVSDYLLRFTGADSSAPVSVIYSSGSAGQEKSFALKEIPIAGGTPTVLFQPTGFSAALIGWGESYDSLIWRHYVSGSSELHRLNLTTKTDELLLSGLSLVE